ncbi:MAG: hypothetical protein OEV99_14575 [Nitrospira sp.]|nr:hypothetical protein [Nitrospira sp.]MDH4371047.1 hypothetical protein [Nitrospira sp.]MDH5498653.1 hypothetical protein [Nitrospira sp.]
MKHVSGQTVKLLNEERALLMTLAAKRDVTYSDVLRIGLYQLAATEGLAAQVMQAVHARVDHLRQLEGVRCRMRLEPTTHPSQTDIMHTGGV